MKGVGMLVWLLAILAFSAKWAIADVSCMRWTKLLRSPDEQVRVRAAEALKKLGPLGVGAMEGLIAARNDRSNSDAFRRACLEAIVSIGDAALPALIARLKNRTDENRYDPAQLLWHLAEDHKEAVAKSALPAILDALDGDPLTVGLVIETLATLGPCARKAIPALEKMLESKIESALKQEIAKALLNIAPAGHERAVRVLREYERGRELVVAALDGDLSEVRSLLELGYDVNSRYVAKVSLFPSALSNYTALMVASAAGSIDVVLFLVGRRADLELKAKGQTALYMAVVRQRREVVELLVMAGAKGNPKQISLTRELIRASCKGYISSSTDPYPKYPRVPRDIETADSIEAVLSRGADVNRCDPEGFTPLMYAAGLGLSNNVDKLISKVANIDLKSATGDTAMSLARASGHKDVERQLSAAEGRRKR
jgi:ankyrin repeat protein